VLRSLYSGVSGMDANQEWIDTIGNDIANVNTTGYKSSEIQFEDFLSQTISAASSPTETLGGVNPDQVGLGVKVAGVETNFSAGTQEQTGNPLDLSIQGNGFFVVNGNGGTYYTQAGQLSLDSNGDLVSPDGYLVQGWQASSAGQINTSAPLTNLTIPSNQSVAATPTTSMTFGGNLAPQTGWTDPTSSSSSSSSSTPEGASSSVTVYEPDGTKKSLDLAFIQNSSSGSGSGGSGSTSGASWDVYAALEPEGSTPSSSDYQKIGTLSFDSSGDISTSGSGSSAGTLTYGSGSSAISLNFGSVTANASSASIAASTQNGSAPGSLQSYSIGTDGVIEGVFTNGETQAIGQIALANFANPGGLLKVGNSNFAETPNSGLAQVGTAASGSLGTVEAGTLEASNVNLASEMTNLIQAQNGFQANTSVIGTDNTLLQDLVNLKNGA
jgi:flagellar hook protein FlgE